MSEYAHMAGPGPSSSQPGSSQHHLDYAWPAPPPPALQPALQPANVSPRLPPKAGRKVRGERKREKGNQEQRSLEGWR